MTPQFETTGQIPMVSCIMPTYNRRHFVSHAIHYFLRQDYSNKELIILDDGTDSIEDLVPSNDAIHYHRLTSKRTLGAKLNMGCELARGEIIANWDDDDWYAPRRLSYQVQALLQKQALICGINRLLYLDLRNQQAFHYVYPADQRLWLLGSSQCYRKELWAAHPFADIEVGMDGLFVWATAPEFVIVLDDPTFSVHTIHDRNVSPKQTNGPYWHPYSVDQIREIMGEDWKYYNGAPSGDMRPFARVDAIIAAVKDQPKPAKNIFACLVHESRECVIDLVRNLHHLDPDSSILLYNGGNDSRLLENHFPFQQYNAIVHPSPRPMSWGRLHDFALDCMKFALQNLPFETLTIVDSDQLAIRSGYSRYLGKFFANARDVGLLGSSCAPQTGKPRAAPAEQALKEFELWRPFLRRFENGESKFVHWTFWPSTVFTFDAARDLVRLFETDQQLLDILSHSRIWASEEIILPTLVALLGYKIVSNPCSYEYVRYQARYSLPELETALARSNVYWIHPVPRRYDNDLRKYVRNQFSHYQKKGLSSDPLTQSTQEEPGFLLTRPILQQMQKIEGWLEEDEADLLIAATAKALCSLPNPHTIVEVGSYCGRATVVMGSVARVVSPGTRMYAIDPHDGKLGSLDEGIRQMPPSLEKLNRNLQQADLKSMVTAIQKRSTDVEWTLPITFLLIDGLHDYVNVAEDFFHFGNWIVPHGYVAFHDYASYFPGVQAFVTELLQSGKFKKARCERSLIVLQKLAS